MVMIPTNPLINRESETPFEGEGNTPMFLLACNVLKRITRFVRVCPVFIPLKAQLLFLRYYIKRHTLVPLYRLSMCCTILKTTHIIIIISTKVQYSIVSVLIQNRSVI
jgi:hypothetical protein